MTIKLVMGAFLLVAGLLATATPASAGKSIFEIERERMERLRIDRGSIEIRERPARRKRFVELKTLGGVVRPILAKRGLGCTSIEAFGRYLDFYFDGIGALPGPEECRPLEVGSRVKVEECDERYLVCRFSAGIFTADFWTSIYAVDPL